MPFDWGWRAVIGSPARSLLGRVGQERYVGLRGIVDLPPFGPTAVSSREPN